MAAGQAPTTDESAGMRWQKLGPGWWRWGSPGVGTEGEPELRVLGTKGKTAA